MNGELCNETDRGGEGVKQLDWKGEERCSLTLRERSEADRFRNELTLAESSPFPILFIEGRKKVFRSEADRFRRKNMLYPVFEGEGAKQEAARREEGGEELDRIILFIRVGRRIRGERGAKPRGRSFHLRLVSLFVFPHFTELNQEKV